MIAAHTPDSEARRISRVSANALFSRYLDANDRRAFRDPSGRTAARLSPVLGLCAIKFLICSDLPMGRASEEWRQLAMKRILPTAMLAILSVVFTATGVPAQAAAFHDSGHYQQVEHRDNHYQRTDDRARYDEHARYDGRYYDYDHHAGRDAAIVAGSAAAGAAIGAAAGHGQGAVVGAILGGVAGLAVDQATQHHGYR